MTKAAAANEVNKKSNAFILIVVLIVFGLVLGGFGFYRYNMGRQSADWPTANGRITYSHASPHKTKNGNEYSASVRYTYTVSGKNHTGTRITSSDQYQKTLGGAKNILSSYPAGRDVLVYYNPSNPTSALLETGIRSNVYIMLGGAVACILFAGLILVSRLRNRQPT